jgi:hypothetical protein
MLGRGKKLFYIKLLKTTTIVKIFVNRIILSLLEDGVNHHLGRHVWEELSFLKVHLSKCVRVIG